VTRTKTKTREGVFAPLEDPPEGHLAEPVELSPEQLARRAEAEEREQQYRREWAEINAALKDNAAAVTRAMSRWHPGEGGRERETERAMTRFENGAFLLNRLGAECVLDQDLATVLLDLRRWLIEEYGAGPVAMMLIDRAVAAYQDFIRVEGWVGNLSIHIEHEFFGIQGPSANFRDRYGREGRSVRGLSVEEHLVRLRESLLPLAERYGRVLSSALASLEAVRLAPSQAVERSRPTKISVRFE
jgi:hypothetical protein